MQNSRKRKKKNYPLFKKFIFDKNKTTKKKLSFSLKKNNIRRRRNIGIAQYYMEEEETKIYVIFSQG
jgi:hypothetical protein